MTNKEFQIQLAEMYKKFPLIDKHEQKTLNELVYVLRMSGEDYQLNTFDKSEHCAWGCIPGVQETFIPVRELAKTVVNVEFDEETYEYMNIKLLMVNLKN